MTLWIIAETSDTTGKPVGNDLREGLLTYPLLSIVNESNQNQLLQDIKNLNHGGNEQGDYRLCYRSGWYR